VELFSSLQTGFPQGCQYHFFSYSDSKARNVAYALRSIAFQLALVLEPFRYILLHTYEETGTKFDDEHIPAIWSKIFDGIIFKMNLPQPLYWVFDALDEAEGGDVLVKLMFKTQSLSPVKIFLTSRLTGKLIHEMNSPLPFLMHEHITEADTDSDLRLYVQSVVKEVLLSDERFQEEVIDKLLQKASGSFLWVTLTLETLKQHCHTRGDIEKAFNETPEGMEKLYCRMVKSIMDMEEWDPTNYGRAREILILASCSARPLAVDEMRVALEGPDRFLNFEQTVIRLCGHFLTVSDSRVRLIHETARSFLLDASELDDLVSDDTRTRSTFLNHRDCHEYIAKICIDYLSRDMWRRLLSGIHEVESAAGLPKRSQLASLLSSHPFLGYATAYWAYHFSQASVKSETLFSAVQNFFDTWALSWIHTAVVLKDLRILTKSAQYLKSYVRKSNRKRSSVACSSLDRGDAQFLQLWAEDLNRIVGKYGLTLSQKPSSIYKQIPPLCPTQSMIYRTYGNTTGTTLSVAGLDSQKWDDSLACLNVGKERISRIVCTETYIVCLTYVGTLTIYYAETFEELRRMVHGEYVNGNVAVNEAGTLAVTAGIQTIKVWELSSSEELYRIPHRTESQTMCVLFGSKDNHLVVCREDASITYYDMKSGCILSAFIAMDPHDRFHSCPNVMKPSPDLTKIALAFRGNPMLIWNMAVPYNVQKPRAYIRAGDRTTRASEGFAMLETVCWHPDSLSLFVLYQDTTIVYYDLAEQTQTEKANTSAKEMVINRDGSLLLTFEQSGVVCLWSLPEFERIYQLQYGDLVRDMTFSCDSQRFYDARGTLCNVWQPDILIHAGDAVSDDLSSSDNTGLPSGPVISTKPIVSIDIACLAPGPDKHHYFCAKDDGTVVICDRREGGRIIQNIYHHSKNAGVTALAASVSGNFVSSCDESGRVVTKHLGKRKRSDRWTVDPVLDFRLDYSALQFLYNTAETLLLVSSRDSDRIWDLEAKSEVLRINRDSNVGIQFANHPTDCDLLLKFEYHQTQILSWETLAVSTSSPLFTRSVSMDPAVPASGSPIQPPSTPEILQANPDPDGVRRVAFSSDRKLIICETFLTVSGFRQSLLETMSTQKLRTERSETPGRERVDLSGLLFDRFLGIYQDDIIFLDTQYWVCSFPLYHGFHGPDSLVRHFPIPKHWVSGSSFWRALTLVEDGTLLCPVQGEVAIFRGGLRR
jgi:WD40 repeat protein